MTNSFEVRILRAPEELGHYRRLLFDAYIHEAGWNFHPANPSGIRISGHELRDDRDDIAICFGVFQEDRLIGGARLCGRHQGQFEIHGYQPHRDLTFLNAPNLIEASRAVLRSEFRGSGVFPLLVRHLFEFCENNQLSVFTVTSDPSVIRLYKRIGMPAVEGCRFKFEPEDPAEAQLFLVDSRGVLDTVLKNLTR
ncbi:GNAT family N-acetyltransferase [Corallococcus praedator]|uniref:GNAT family N-acetyltransferase n=1 Tax=Corallococcus praedator TaxID=2316724 RepID=A0ABX9QNR4_9BACT|nr:MULTISPECIES: GNAT family N-acetyltransferase [Corallococcus]RKH21503.1 GNAT family N-acetyltransferase [Corallococcus sp. CA047B]RKH35746.1 GNAT family N-acetyltransferase [Corallococcus sp. CA031C]RKI14004.1 GNAT family N-acetyltransferase [Corallococcus praedator]